MKAILGMVFLGLVAMAAPCCLTQKGSFDFIIMSNRMPLTGSAAFDFTAQKFSVHLPIFQLTGGIDLSQDPGYLYSFMSPNSPYAGGEKRPDMDECREVYFNGTVDNRWQCILDNKAIFTKVEGSPDYNMEVTRLIKGLISMKNGVCFPSAASVVLTVPTGRGPMERIPANVQIKNLKTTYPIDAFKLPCKLSGRKDWRGELKRVHGFPTPEEFLSSVIPPEPRSDEEDDHWVDPDDYDPDESRTS